MIEMEEEESQHQFAVGNYNHHYYSCPIVYCISVCSCLVFPFLTKHIQVEHILKQLLQNIDNYINSSPKFLRDLLYKLLLCNFALKETWTELELLKKKKNLSWIKQTIYGKKKKINHKYAQIYMVWQCVYVYGATILLLISKKKMFRNWLYYMI